MRIIYLFLLVFATSPSWALTCKTNYNGGCASASTAAADCESQSFENSEIENCAHYIYCPFNTSYKKCVSLPDKINTCAATLKSKGYTLVTTASEFITAAKSQNTFIVMNDITGLGDVTLYETVNIPHNFKSFDSTCADLPIPKVQMANLTISNAGGSSEYSFYPNLSVNLVTMGIDQFELYNGGYIGDGINFEQAGNIYFQSMDGSQQTYRLNYAGAISGNTQDSQLVIFDHVLVRSEDTAMLNTNIYFDEPGGCIESVYNGCEIKACFTDNNSYSDTIVPESYAGSCGNTNCLPSTLIANTNYNITCPTGSNACTPHGGCYFSGSSGGGSRYCTASECEAKVGLTKPSFKCTSYPSASELNTYCGNACKNYLDGTSMYTDIANMQEDCRQHYNNCLSDYYPDCNYP